MVSVASPAPRGAARPFRARRASTPCPLSVVDRALALICLIALLILNVSLPSLLIADVPVRSVAASGMMVLLAILYPAVAAAAVRECRPLLAIAGVLGAIGIFVSVVNAMPADLIARAVMEMVVQSAVMIVVAFMVARMCGARLCVIAIVSTVAIGGIIALMQAMGVETAWEVRRLLASVQAEPLDEPDRLEVGRRALGLSYSTIQFATQLCLAFVLFTAVRDKGRRGTPLERTADVAVVPALFAFVAASAATGNRSPILGAVLFLILYAMKRRGSWIPLLLMSGALVLLLAWPSIMAAMATGEVRVLRTDDQSAVGRMPMVSFGVRLFLDNPLGYGFAFKPFDHWTAYWDQFYTLPGAVVIQTRHLHNYVLNMVNTYGVGLLLLVPLLIALLRESRASLIFFLPYVVHIMFHNSGPFWNDMLIWFVIATIAVAREGGPVGQNGGPVVRRRPVATGRGTCHRPEAAQW